MKNICIAVSVLLIACSSETRETERVTEPGEKPIPVVHINDKLESRILKLSEIVDIERIVRLETRRDVLLPAPASVGVKLTGKYILTLDRNNLRQFSSEGKFIRNLSSAGKGPREYYGMSANVADPVHNIFYFTNGGDRKYIQVIDLNTGKWLEKIKYPEEQLSLPELSRVGSLLLVNDSTFLCVVHMLPENPYTFFYMSTKGKFLGSMKITEDIYTPFIGPPKPYCIMISGRVHYLGPNADTLYLIQDNKKSPFCVFDVENKLSEKNIAGNSRGLLLGSTRFTLFYTQNSALYRASDGNIMIDPKKIQPQVRYYVDYKSFKSWIISDFELDYLGFKLKEIVYYPNSNGEIALLLPAEQFKEKAKTVLKENTAPAEVLKRVKELDAQITENDNPILLIGKLK